MRKRRIYTVIWSVIVILAFIVPANAAVPSPVNIERKTVRGAEYIVKTFTVSGNITAEMLVENDFEEDGYMFSHINTERRENVSESVRHVTQQATLDSSTNSRTTILSQFTQSINYSGGGYFGTLTLDANSLVTRPSGYGTRNVPVNRTREFRNLMFNDPSVVPQSIIEDGITLTLSSIDWVITGTALAGNALVPVEYKAVASYSGTHRVSYILGYTTTVNYTGIVTRRTVDSISYTITYAGTPIPPTTTEPETLPMPEPPADDMNVEEAADEHGEGNGLADSEGGDEERNGVGWILPTAILLCLAAAGGGIYYFKYAKKKQLKAEVYNLINDEYILLGTEPLDNSDEATLSVDLDKFSEAINSNSFGFVLDKHSVEALNGRPMTVSYNGETLVHEIQNTDNSTEYRFKLIFGGEINNNI